MSHKPVTIYALAASDEPGKFRYVGMTTDLERRRKAHKQGKGSLAKAYRAWAREACARGATIQLTVLEAQIPNPHRIAVESAWIQRLRSEGCILVNTVKYYGWAGRPAA